MCCVLVHPTKKRNVMLRPSIHLDILYHFLLLITSISSPYFFNILQYVRVLFIVFCTTRYQDHYFAWLPSSLLHPVYVYVFFVLQYILYTLHTFVFIDIIKTRGLVFCSWIKSDEVLNTCKPIVVTLCKGNIITYIYLKSRSHTA